MAQALDQCLDVICTWLGPAASRPSKTKRGVPAPSSLSKSPEMSRRFTRRAAQASTADLTPAWQVALASWAGGYNWIILKEKLHQEHFRQALAEDDMLAEPVWECDFKTMTPQEAKRSRAFVLAMLDEAAFRYGSM